MTITAPIDPRIEERRQAVAHAATRQRKRQLLLALAVVACGAAAFAALHSPLFDVDRITVKGDVTDPDAVAAASGVRLGQALIDVDLGGARSSIVALPQVASVTSRRSWAGEVTFDVVPREPVARIETATGTGLMVDAAGRILARDTTPDSSSGVLVIAGLNPDDDGRAGWVDETAAEAIRTAASVPSDIAAVSDRLWAGPTTYRLELRSGATAILGDIDSIDAQMTALRAVLSSVDMECASSIDLRNPSSPVLSRDPVCAAPPTPDDTATDHTATDDMATDDMATEPTD